MLKIALPALAIMFSLIAASLLAPGAPAASAQLLSIQPGAGGDGRVKPASILKMMFADSSSNSSPQKIDSVFGTVVVDAGAHTSTAEILVEETGADTGVFEGAVQTSRIASTTAIHVAAGDTVIFGYRDEFPSDYRERVQSAIPAADKKQAFPAHALIEADVGACSLTPSLAPAIAAAVREEATINAALVNNAGQKIEYIAIFEVRNARGSPSL